MSRADIKAGSSYVELYVKDSRLVRGLNAAKARLAKFSTDAMGAGRQMVIASAMMLAPIALATKAYADFDDQMRAVQAVTTQGAKSFKDLTETAKELGRTTSFTATEVASLMAELGRAGFDTSQVDAMTGSVLSLSRATGTDAAESAGIMAATIRQFGLEATDAGRVADSFTAAANKSFNTVSQLAEAMSYAGPVAKDMGVSLEDTLAIMGGLGNVGIQGSEAGTAMRRLLVLSGAEAEKMKKIFGVTFKDAAGNARPLVDVLGEVNDATKSLGTADRAAKFSEAFGLLGITGASAIGNSVGDIRELAKAIKEAGGIADEAAAKMDSGLGGAFRIVLSAMEGVQLAIGEAIEGPMMEVAAAVQAALGKVTAMVEANKEAVLVFTKWAAVVGAVGAGLVALGVAASVVTFMIGGIVSTIGALAFVIGAPFAIITGAFGLLMTPIGMVAVGIAAAVSALILFTDTGRNAAGSAINAFGKMGDTIGKAFARVKEIAGEAFGGIKDAVMSGDLELAGQIAMAALKKIVTEGIASISQMIGGIWGDTFATFATQLMGGNFSGAWDTVVMGMSEVWATFTQGVTNTALGMASLVVDAWKGAVDKITNYLLQKASEGGVFGAFFEQISGVDVAEEMARAEKLNAQIRARGGNQGEGIAEQIRNGTYEDPAIAGMANAMQAGLRAAIDANNARVPGAALPGNDATNKAKAAADKAGAELAELLFEGAYKRFASGPGGRALGMTGALAGGMFGGVTGGMMGGVGAAMLAGGKGGKGAGAPGDETAGAGGVSGTGVSKSIGGTNIAGVLAMAQGIGGSPQVKAIQRVEKSVEDVKREMQAASRMMIHAIGMGGGIPIS